MCQCVSNMFLLIGVLFLTNIAWRAEGLALPQPHIAKILDYENIPPAPNGEYEFWYLTEDGIERREIAEVKNAGTPNEVLEVKGEYGYTHNGEEFNVYYIADENGYRILESSPFKEPPVLLPAPALASLIGGGLGK